MARPAKNTPIANAAEVEVGNGANTLVATEVSYAGFTHSFESLPTHAIAYLAQYGFAKSLQDSVAGLRAKLETGYVKAAEENETEVDEDAMAEAVDAELHRVMSARVEAILSGTIGTRARGPRVRGIDKVMTDVATEMLKAAFSKVGKPFPKGQELGDLVAKVIAKREDEIRAEATRRMNATEGLDDLLA